MKLVKQSLIQFEFLGGQEQAIENCSAISSIIITKKFHQFQFANTYLFKLFEHRHVRKSVNNSPKKRRKKFPKENKIQWISFNCLADYTTLYIRQFKRN